MSKTNPMHTSTEQEILEPEASNLPALDFSTLKPSEIFVPGGLAPFVNTIKTEVRKELYDVTTADGRKRIASVSYAIAKAKNALDKMGKDYTEDWQKKVKVVNTERKAAWDALEALQKEIRKPLTDFEEAEAARQKRLKDAIETAEQAGQFAMNRWMGDDVTVEAMQDRIKELEHEFTTTDFQEFTEWAAKVYPTAIQLTKSAIASKKQYMADQERLKELERQQAEHDRAERERKIAEEAAARAREDEDRKNKAEAERLATAAREAQEKAQRETREANERADKAKKDAEAAIAKAKDDAERVVREAKEKAEAVERARVEAAELERKRIADEQAAKKSADDKRMADETHRATVMSNLSNAFMERLAIKGGDQAHLVAELVESIKNGEIANITVNF